VSATATPPGVFVRVPASTANLGSGFDVLAAALALHLEVEVRETGTFGVETDLAVPNDRSNLVVRAFELLHPADPYAFRISSAIPLTGGLGSSAAAIVAGLLSADRLHTLRADVLSLATPLEGHPDNLGAALEGGFVVCDGVRVHRLDPPPGLRAVLVVPDEPVGTEAARAALPDTVPMQDAVFNIGRVALLVRGLSTGDLELIASGLDDRLHQQHRAHLYPRSAELLAQARSLGALGATISGAGPTVLFWSAAGRAAQVAAELTARAAGWARVLVVDFEPAGAEVSEL
jgi:homoserine kinase